MRVIGLNETFLSLDSSSSSSTAGTRILFLVQRKESFHFSLHGRFVAYQTNPAQPLRCRHTVAASTTSPRRVCRTKPSAGDHPAPPSSVVVLILSVSPSQLMLHPLSQCDHSRGLIVVSLWHRCDRSKQGRRHIKIFCFLSHK